MNDQDLPDAEILRAEGECLYAGPAGSRNEADEEVYDLDGQVYRIIEMREHFDRPIIEISEPHPDDFQLREPGSIEVTHLGSREQYDKGEANADQ